MKKSGLLLIVLLGCANPKPSETRSTGTPTDSIKQSSQSRPTATSNEALSFAIIDASQGTFGYDILKDGKVFIHQPHLPGVAGNLGFARKEQAERAANLMIEKLRKNIVPPTISEEELNSILKQ